ncbi:MAG: mycothiol S-conjugate amidase [Acidimicrobiaceae bacterium]|jgi:mycothiol S-conjugate amidase
MNESQLRLLTVHAHPDDESSKGAGTIAKYHDEGAWCVLVCCTGGEAGDILNPAMDTPEVKGDIANVRRRELERAAEILGYDELVWLGYRDSGMPDSPENADPRSFAAAELDDAVERLVAIIRRVRPHVVVTYPDEQSRYPHPDHLRVHEISDIAFDAAGDPERFPNAGEPWQPLKLYYTTWSRDRIVAMHEKMLELGLESPYARWFEQSPDDPPPPPPPPLTTRIEVSAYYGHRKEALLAHATQIDPQSPFWFALPDDVAATVYPYDDYTLARSLVDSEPPEDDLFAGVRELVYDPPAR